MRDGWERTWPRVGASVRPAGQFIRDSHRSQRYVQWWYQYAHAVLTFLHSETLIVSRCASSRWTGQRIPQWPCSCSYPIWHTCLCLGPCWPAHLHEWIVTYELPAIWVRDGTVYNLLNIGSQLCDDNGVASADGNGAGWVIDSGTDAHIAMLGEQTWVLSLLAIFEVFGVVLLGLVVEVDVCVVMVLYIRGFSDP